MMRKPVSHSAKFLQRRKFFVALPLIVFPFLTMLFWALGGGKGVQAAGNNKKTIQGFNMDLPAAKNPSDSAWNKLNYYDQADKDSARLRQLIKSDPYYNLPLTDTELSDTSSYRLLSNAGRRLTPGDSTEKILYRKLAVLDQQLNKQVSPASSDERVHKSMTFSETPANIPTTDVDRLEKMMQSMREGNDEADPQLVQLNGMLDKIMDIQHPERIQQKLQEQSIERKGKIFTVEESKEETISVLQPSLPDRAVHPASANGFYSLDSPATLGEQMSNAIEGVVSATQTLTSGATIKIELLQEIFINGILIPAHHFVYGTAQLSTERLMITISSILYKDHLLPVSLAVYDLDGIAGIYVPGAITRDVAKQSADQSLQSVGMLSLDPSIAAQATSAGIQTAKNLLSKKVKQVKVTVNSGYQVLLRDMNAKK